MEVQLHVRARGKQRTYILKVSAKVRSHVRFLRRESGKESGLELSEKHPDTSIAVVIAERRQTEGLGYPRVEQISPGGLFKRGLTVSGRRTQMM